MLLLILLQGLCYVMSNSIPTRVYAAYKTGTSDQINTMCRMCGEVTESLAHVLAGCSSLVQTKYMDRHGVALKLLFFEMLRDLKLADSRWYSRMEPKPLRVRDRFCLSNRINEPTRVTKTSKSLIDVLLTSHEGILCYKWFFTPWTGRSRLNLYSATK